MDKIIGNYSKSYERNQLGVETETRKPREDLL